MAASKQTPVNKRRRLIDPVYKKFTAQAFKLLTSEEFYDYFMAMMANGNHEFQFSNKRLDKEVDETWVNIIEATLPAIEEICRNPRIIITQEELVVNVVQARRIDAAVVKHLCAHSNLVESVDEDGNVVPSKVMNIFKEESWDTYENRFVFTLLDKTFRFVEYRYKQLFEELGDEYGANLHMNCNASTALETMEMKIHLKIQQKDDWEETEGQQDNIFARIKRMYFLLLSLMDSRFAHEMSKYPFVRPPLVPTNAIKKNPFLRKCHKLWDFLLTYSDVGYSIEIIEQNPEINEKFEQDIWDNVMFTYIILKGYLEDTRDRAIDFGFKGTKKKLKPKYIKEIIEELVKDYDLPDVEVRKVLIEELTKEQLMKEEKEERRRLVEAQEKERRERIRQENIERKRLQKEKEREEKRLAREKELEAIRLQQQKEKEAARKKREEERKKASDEKKGILFLAEIRKQMSEIEEMIERKEAQREREEGRLKNEDVIYDASVELAEEIAQEIADEIIDEITEEIIAESGDELTLEEVEVLAERIADSIANEIAEEVQDNIEDKIQDAIIEDISDELNVEEISQAIESAMDEVFDEIMTDVLDESLEAVEEGLAEVSASADSPVKRESLRERLTKWLARK